MAESLAQHRSPELPGEDVDGDALTWSLGSPAHGALWGTPPALRYVPDADFHGVDELVYIVGDGVEQASGRIAIAITPVNDAPVAGEDVYEVVAGETLVVPAPGLLANDTDADGDALTVTLVSAGGVEVELAADGGLVVTAPGTAGEPSLRYRVTDADGESTVGTVRVLPVEVGAVGR